MLPAALEQLVTTHRTLIVRQQHELAEILTNWEVANRYEVLTSDQRVVGHLLERSSGFAGLMKRSFFRARRPLEIALLSPQGEQLLVARRPFTWLFSKLWVATPQGGQIGRVRRRFSLLHKRFDLENADEQCLATIKSPLWRIWTFNVAGTDAVIKKRWGGVLREAFTDADTFEVDFGSEDWSAEQRALLLMAAVAIDFDFFEQNHRG